MQKRYTVKVVNQETGEVQQKISGLDGAWAVEQRDMWARTCEAPSVCVVEIER